MLLRALGQAETIIIGAGAGLSTFAGFLERHQDTNVLFLELGVGYNTPGIIKYPFWKMTNDWRHAVYTCVNKGETFVPEEIRTKAVCINDDINTVIELTKGA